MKVASTDETKAFFYKMIGDYSQNGDNPGEIFFRAVEQCTQQCNGCVKVPLLRPDCYECGEFYDVENDCYMEPLYSECASKYCLPQPLPPCLECVDYMVALVKFKHDECTYPGEWFSTIQNF